MIVPPKKKKTAAGLSFPEDEKTHHWLSLLLACHTLFDEGVARAIARKAKKEGKALACRKGCDTCCRTQGDMPVYPHELTGIYWYCIKKIKQPTRGVLRNRLVGNRGGESCPFIVGGTCLIHLLRPAGCRQFNVFGRVCEEGEDPFHTRRQDVMTPLREYTHRAFTRVLPLYGVDEKKADKVVTVEKIIQTQVVNIRTYDWRKLASRMSGYAPP